MATPSMQPSFTVRVNGLISDPAFHKYAAITGEPNIFSIVGQSRYERWHSAFWGWLLDPNGSHGIGDYALSRMLLALFTERSVKPKSWSAMQDAALARVDFDGIEVRPNEYNHAEVIIDVGKLDIYITGKVTYGDGNSKGLNIIIEMKVDTKTRSDQSKKYADWLMTNHPGDTNLLVYVLPSREMGSTPDSTVGDSRWFCIDFQTLHDEVLLPILDHHGLDPKVKPFVIQYVGNLRIPYKGSKMAMTEEEKRLARALYDKYSDVFDSLSEALRSEGIEFEVEPSDGPSTRGAGRIAVKIEGKLVEGNSVGELFKACLKYLVDSGAVKKMALPWGTGTKRYFIAKGPNPQHPNGRDFFAPVEYENYVLESHMDRARSIKVLEDLCNHLEVSFALVEV